MNQISRLPGLANSVVLRPQDFKYESLPIAGTNEDAHLADVYRWVAKGIEVFPFFHHEQLLEFVKRAYYLAGDKLQYPTSWANRAKKAIARFRRADCQPNRLLFSPESNGDAFPVPPSTSTPVVDRSTLASLASGPKLEEIAENLLRRWRKRPGVGADNILIHCSNETRERWNELVKSYDPLTVEPHSEPLTTKLVPFSRFLSLLPPLRAERNAPNASETRGSPSRVEISDGEREENRGERLRECDLMEWRGLRDPLTLESLYEPRISAVYTLRSGYQAGVVVATPKRWTAGKADPFKPERDFLRKFLTLAEEVDIPLELYAP